MALLGISNLHYAYGDRHILAGVNITLNEGEHVGLVGLNGCGKSTLMKIIAGLGGLKADAGQVQLARGARAGYLSQHPELEPGRTLREEAGAAFEQLYRLHRKLDKLQHEMEAAGGYAIDHRIDATLHGLGIGDETFGVKVADLSGGQKGRLALAKLLLSDPDLLLLDEPTNHLDIDGRAWLEQYLASYRGAVILISHDRWLLDRCVTKIYELSDGVLEEYPGNYHKYRELRAERLAFRLREYEKQQDRVRREQAFIDRYRAGQRARQAQGREKRLERFKRDELLDRPIAADTIDLRLRSVGRTGDHVIVADHIAKGYEGKPLFGPLEAKVKRGDRIGVIGPNGSGKTTLVNCLLGRLEPDRGSVRLGAQVDVGYYRQTHAHLDLSLTVVEYLQRITGSEQSARDLAGAFLFSGIDQDKPLKVLSGGERSRTVLAGLVSGGHNLLVLDEPTNHLDIPSSERLEEALCAYAAPPKGFGANTSGGGTLILITHDRMLLDNTVDQLLIFDGRGGVRHFFGNYSDYLQSQQSPAQAVETSKPAPAPKPAAARKTSGRFGGLNPEKLEAKINDLTARIAGVDEQLASPDVYRDGAKIKALQQQRDAATAELAGLEEEWLRRAEA
jgi:ATP-binding cassette, subfamily F, member 3